MSKRNLSQQQKRRVEQKREGDRPYTEGQQALVIMNSGKQALVRLSDGSSVRCHQRANLANVVAGDLVIVSSKEDNWVIESLLPRRSLLSRPGFRGVIKPIAANIDQLILVIAPAPGIDLELLDRSLCFCEWQQLDAIIVLNKCDLLDASYRELTDELANYYRHIGYPWIETSTHNQTGLAVLQQACIDKTSVFIGNSGVGKSSLIQTLLPHEAIRTQTLSESTGFGQHTTNNATLYDLPSGGELIDAAGIRSLNLAEFSIAHPDRYWREFRPLLGQCRFHNCTHSHEPDCAIRSAVEAGNIDELRYQHYLKVLHESADKLDENK